MEIHYYFIIWTVISLIFVIKATIDNSIFGFTPLKVLILLPGVIILGIISFMIILFSEIYYDILKFLHKN